MIAAGQSIGNYRILSKIGTGGMGAVYLAEHPLIGKRVALKVIHRELAGNRDVVSRFFQEARAVNKIGNDHIVEIHDFGVTPEGDHFFIMEYLEGQTLAAVMSRDGKLEVMRSLHVGAQIASALAAAHASGIIHRDLKPDNVMLLARLGDRDFVKVLDFGLAKVFSAATAVKTAAGVLLGTPHYMSPEACESKGDVDHRTDIYALGVLLFQMMTGSLPFTGESMGEVLVKQVTMLPPAPRGINAAIPPSVEQILLRCLAKRADARFATMQLLREALLDPEAYLRASPPISPARYVTQSMRLSEPQPPPRAQPPVPAHQQKTRLATANPLPLPAPAPSQPGSAASAPTLIDRGSGGGSGGGSGRGSGRGSGGHDRGPPGAPAAPRLTNGMTALAHPQEPKMNTMRIATPLGYSSRPPRRIWPMVFAAAALLGVGFGVVVTRCGHVSEPALASGSAADPAAASTGSDGSAVATGSSASPSAAAATSSPVSATTGAAPSVGSAASGSASGSSSRKPAVRLARLSIDSVPTGAQISGPSGEPLGTAPLKLDWPVSDLPVAFELTLPGYRTKQKRTVVNGNTALHIELDRIEPARHAGKPTSAPRPTAVTHSSPALISAPPAPAPPAQTQAPRPAVPVPPPEPRPARSTNPNDQLAPD